MSKLVKKRGLILRKSFVCLLVVFLLIPSGVFTAIAEEAGETGTGESQNEPPGEPPSGPPGDPSSEPPGAPPSEPPGDPPSDPPGDPPSDPPSEDPPPEEEPEAEPPEEEAPEGEEENPLAATLRLTRDSDLFHTVVTVISATLQKNGSSTPIADDDVIYLNDDLKLTYTFTMDENQVGAVKNLIDTGSTASYSIPVTIPGGLVVSGTGTADILLSLPGGGVLQLGELTVSSTGATLTFKGSFWTSGRTIVDEAFIFIACRLDASQTDEENKITVQLGQTNVKVKVGDNIDKDHELVKTGNYSAATNEITWKITYTPGSGELSDSVIFTDTFDHTNHTYVDGSFKVKIDNAEQVLNGTFAVADNPPNTIITYELPKADVESAGSVVFEYKTKLTNEAFNKWNENTELTNHAEVEYNTDLGNSVVAEDTVTLLPKDKPWLKKEVTNKDSSSSLVFDDVIKWKVTIYTHGVAVEPLVLHDTFGDGLELIPDSVKINGASATPTMPGNCGCSFELTIPKNSSGAYDEVYVVTYETKIDPECFNGEFNPPDTRFSNKAWLTFDGGMGPHTSIPEVELGGVGINAHILQKTGEYSRATGKIKWTVTVNPHMVDVRSGTITDDLTGTGLTYVQDSYTPLDNNARDFLNLNPDPVQNNTLIIEVGALGPNIAKFTFETTVDDKDHFAGNEVNGNGGLIQNNYTNKVEFEGWITYESVDKFVEDDASHTVSVTSQVLAKTAGVYNHEDHTVTWKITVNQNKMHMENVKLIDTIGEYQTFVEGSVTVSPGLASPYPVVSSSGSQVTIELGDIDAQHTVTLKTKVDVDAEPFTEQDSVIVDNHVTLSRDIYNDVEVSADKEIENKILVKSGEYHSDRNIISYAININPNGMDLQDLTLRDTLPDGLRLDIDSVKLYKAKVNDTTGKFEKVSEVTNVNYWSYDATGNTFLVHLPTADCYVLEYDCFVIYNAEATYTNEVTFEGSYLESSVNWTEEMVTVFGGGGWLRDNLASLKIVKETRESPQQPLKDVTFELYAMIGNILTLVDRGTTDRNGELTFYFLNPSRDYWLKETVPAPGYNIQSAVVVDGNTTTPLNLYKIELDPGDKKKITIRNSLNTGTVTFRKRDNYGMYMKGTVFELTNKPGTHPYSATAYSAPSGTVTFTNVPVGEYWLTEVSTDNNHEMNYETFSVVVDINGRVTITNSSGRTVTEIVNRRKDTGGGGTTDPDDPRPPVTPPPTDPTPPEEPSEPDTDTPDDNTEPEDPRGLPSLFSPGDRLVPTDDGGYIEIDENDVPLGKWTYDPEQELWTFDPFPIPLAGDGLPPVALAVSLLGVVLLLLGIVLKRHAPDGRKHE